ncbi:MAG: molybdate ABC transporter permease subunit [Bacillota bacterium]
MNKLDLFPLMLSLRVAGIATMLAVLAGLPLAWYLARQRGRLADLLDSLITLPLVLPPTVLGYYLLVALGRQSPIGHFLEQQFGLTLVFTPRGAVIAACVASIPYFIKSARAALEGVGRDLVDAARTLGRTEGEIFWAIIVPIAWRGLAAGGVLTFARALGDFGTTLMVAGGIPGRTLTMPIAIYNSILAGDRGMANLLVAVMTLAALAVIFTLNRLQRSFIRGRD